MSNQQHIHLTQTRDLEVQNQHTSSLTGRESAEQLLESSHEYQQVREIVWKSSLNFLCLAVYRKIKGYHMCVGLTHWGAYFLRMFQYGVRW